MAAMYPGLPTYSQEAPPPQVSSITVNSRLVVLDVTVTDKAGKPVRDLKREDFRVFEDNQPRPVRSFETPSEHSLPPQSATISTVFDPAHPAAFGQSPVMILMLDQLNTHFADSSFARRELHDYLAAQPALLPQPTNLLTIYDNQFHQLAGFTRDRDALLQALAKAPVKNSWILDRDGKSEGGPFDRLQQSLEALEQMVQSYAQIAGRKNLLWVGGGFPTTDPTMIDGDDAKEVKNMLQHVTDLLLASHVTLYAVDPTSSAVGLTEITTIEQSNFAMAAGGLSSGIDPFNSKEDFDRLGPVTGGRVIRGKNDLRQQIEAAVSLSDIYYTIGYEPAEAPNDSSYRHIRVECLRPGLKVSTREGYYPLSEQQRVTQSNMADDLQAALRSSVRLNGILVQAQREASAAGSEKYLLHVRASDLTWKPNTNGAPETHVEAVSAQFSNKEKLLNHTVQAMTATAKPDTDLHDPARGVDFVLSIPANAHTVKTRFIIRDAASGRMGSVDLP